MAKGKKGDAKADKRKKNAEKYNEPNDFYRTINETTIGKVTVTTQACHVRGKGTMIREVSSTGSVSAYFIPDTKIKKKKEWLNIVAEDSEEKKAAKAAKRAESKKKKGKGKKK